MRISTVFLAAVVSSLAIHFADPHFSFAQTCARPWVFFDVGNTLIVTKPDPSRPDHLKDIHYIPGALRYLRILKRDFYPLGVISNLPEGWGDEGPYKNVQDKRTRQLLQTQLSFSQDWQAGTPEFDWTYFGKMTGSGNGRTYFGNVYFPNLTGERKPAVCATCVFNRALATAQDAGCPALYVGESEDEMRAAEKAGFIPFLLTLDHGEGVFLPPGYIETYIKNYQPGGWKP
ncbi:MAG: hypothetical protein H7222_10045 [Methylotenera sp.]|nr:hypothetical protein [Oligoflexia bacterium]